METPLSLDLSSEHIDIQPTFIDIGNNTMVGQPISSNQQHEKPQKPKLSWDKLSKFVQWKLFTAYMHENNLTDGNLFKRMRSMVSEKRTNPFVQFNVDEQKIIHVDFKHEVFIRERSKKGKLKVQVAQANEEAKIKALEASINGVSIFRENIEIIEEEHMRIEQDFN
jgi:major membrane immunogen (membrane-anchored lipoprotein)